VNENDVCLHLWRQAGKREGKSPPEMANVHDSVLGVISSTPMVKMGRSPPAEVQQAAIHVKMEIQNPLGGVKNRIAKAMIEAAENANTISPERTTVVEWTSGNTGIGMATVCAAKGYSSSSDP